MRFGRGIQTHITSLYGGANASMTLRRRDFRFKSQSGQFLGTCETEVLEVTDLKPGASKVCFFKSDRLTTCPSRKHTLFL